MLTKQLKGISKDSLYYGVGTALRRFFALFTAPIMTRIFTPDDYGVMGLITSTIAFASLILMFGINGGIFRHYYEVNDKEKKVLLFSGISSFTIILTIFVIIGIISAESISILLFKSSNYTNILRIALIQVPIVQLFEHFTTLLRYQNKVKQFVIFSGLQLFLNLLFLLFYVVYLRLGLVGVYLNTITANAIPLVIIVVMLRKYYVWRFNINYIKDIFMFSIPLMPGWIINLYLMKSGIFFLQAYHTTTEVGLFTIATRIATIAGMFMSIFFLAWDPLSYKLIAEKRKHHVYDSVARIFVFLVSILVIVIAFYAKEVLIVLTTEKYYPAYKIVGFIALGTMTFYLNYFLGMGIIIAKKTIYQSYARLAGAISSSIIFFYFIPTYGVNAAAIGLITGYLSSSIGLYFFSKRLYKLPYKIGRISISYLITLSSIILYFIISSSNYSLSIITIGLKFVIILIIVTALFFTLFDNFEISRVKTILIKFKDDQFGKRKASIK
jgi:O-antigen/teichoic acid export membrane protein